jgi:phosphoglycerate dehydrogenase-like enzyme
VLPECDFVCFAVPLTDQTKGMLGKEAIDALKPGAFVVNICRGAVIEKEPFVAALRSGKIAGAGLDVFWVEPPDPNDEFLEYQVTATLHSASYTDLFVKNTAALIADNVARVERGDEVLHRVDG